MNALVTGATGFVGANVARLLVAEGYRVRVLARPTSSLRALEGCAVEVVRGDILEPGSVTRAIKGCAPHVRVPYALIHLVALVNEAAARATGRPPRVPLAGVRMARKHMYFSAEKAVRELGLPQTPVAQALREAVDWFVAHGYAPPPPAYRARVA